MDPPVAPVLPAGPFRPVDPSLAVKPPTPVLSETCQIANPYIGFKHNFI